MSMLLMLVLIAGVDASPALSPDGRYLLEIVSEEVRMSHWIDRPSLFRRSDECRLWQAGPSWSLDGHRWLGSDELEMELRAYPGARPPVNIRLYLETEVFEDATGAR